MRLTELLHYKMTMNLAQTILRHCRAVDCNCVPWRVDGDRPVHLPPDEELNVYAAKSLDRLFREVGVRMNPEHDYDVVVLTDGLDADAVFRVKPHGKISVLIDPKDRNQLLVLSRARSLQLINENLIGADLHCVFRPPRVMTAPAWDGQSAGTVLVFSDGGFGDDFFAARHPMVMRSDGLKFIFEARAEEASLMRECSFYDQICVKGERLPPHDYCVPVSELNKKVVRADFPYLKKPPPVGLPSTGKTKIGLVLEGHYVKLGPKRALAPELFSPPRSAQFYLFRKNDHRAKRPDVKNAIDLSGVLGNWLDTASYLDQMDFVISVDTSVVHLAAAMGKEVRVVLEPDHHNFYCPVNERTSPHYGKNIRAYWGDPKHTTAAAVREIVAGSIKCF